MKLGIFSLSISVKDLEVSKEFYQKIGFEHFAGSTQQNYLIMKNGETIIGLFQGMFKGNLLTFNPGWDSNAQTLSEFDDIRKLQTKMLENGVEIANTIDTNSQGPASFFIQDPDGNSILFDQHI
jgi:lactoylglutathione lyase